jgi:hypothetical protein
VCDLGDLLPARSHVYAVPPDAVALAAKERALAMRYSEEWVALLAAVHTAPTRETA